MSEQIHKRLSNEFVKSILEKYIKGELKVKQCLLILQIKKTRFFELVKEFKTNPSSFSISYKRKSPTNKLDPTAEKIIIEELKREKELIIDNPDVPVNFYNYSSIKTEIERKYDIHVSLPTIIKIAKENKYYKARKKKEKHTKEVITEYAGELIQHDSSYHKFSPYADRKWYLITTLDDYSRYILYARLVEKEVVWEHIKALEDVFLGYGIPIAYYTDSHSIFRFVQGRDSIWREHKKVTDEVSPQFKQILEELGVRLIYAISPQAKGKIERSYRWIQDRLVRRCVREYIKDIRGANEILEEEIKRYNERQVHSMTKEIPIIRLEKAIKRGKSLFREFKIPEPYEDIKDIFCYRIKRRVDGYHKISIKNEKIRIRGVEVYEEVEVRVIPDYERGISELRIWHKGRLVDKKIIKRVDIV